MIMQLHLKAFKTPEVPEPKAKLHRSQYDGLGQVCFSHSLLILGFFFHAHSFFKAEVPVNDTVHRTILFGSINIAFPNQMLMLDPCFFLCLVGGRGMYLLLCDPALDLGGHCTGSQHGGPAQLPLQDQRCAQAHPWKKVVGATRSRVWSCIQKVNWCWLLNTPWVCTPTENSILDLVPSSVGDGFVDSKECHIVWCWWSLWEDSVCRFMEPAVITLLGGVLPFGSIFIEM